MRLERGYLPIFEPMLADPLVRSYRPNYYFGCSKSICLSRFESKMRNLYEFFHRVPLNEKNSKGHRFKAEVKMYNLYFAEIFYIGKHGEDKMKLFLLFDHRKAYEISSWL